MATLTLLVGILTLGIALYILVLEIRAARARARAAQVWRTLDECMAAGYRHMDSGPSHDSAWQWLERVARFCERALGYHAMRLVLQDGTTSGEIASKGWPPDRAIMLALTRIHDHVAGKVAEGRIDPDFDEVLWKGWTPDLAPPE